jgi:Mn-dependent DtxR family transcriptional regulator
METSSSTTPSSRGRAIAAEVKRVKRIVETFMVNCAGVVWALWKDGMACWRS